MFTHAHWTPGRKIDPAKASAVQGPWQPRPVNSSGTWNVDDVRTECLARAIHTPPEPTPIPEPPEDAMPTAMIIVANGGATPGALAVTDLAMTTKRFIHPDDATRLGTTNFYGNTQVTLEGDVFDGIPTSGEQIKGTS